MSDLDNIVQIFISRETTQIDTASFDKPLFLVELPDDVDNTDPMNPVLTPADVSNRVRTYTNLEDIATDYTTNSSAYRMASKAFGGTQRPTTLYIGVKNTAETYAAGLTACIAASNDWYALAADTKTQTNILAMAAIIEAQKKVYFASSADAAIINPSSTTDVGYLLDAGNYDRTVLVYSPTATTEHPECAWLGGQIVEVPGSNTWAFKSGNGITATKLSGTAVSSLKAKHVNYFTTIAGADIFMDGVTSKGSFIDEVIFVDWLYARMQEQVFYRFINKKKIPYTQAGATIIGAEIRSVLSQGVANGGIAPTPPFKVIEPQVLAIPEVTRATRVLGDFKFEARLAGAAHAVIIRGVVSA
jgi:Protein of unknown function (DUF3383)